MEIVGSYPLEGGRLYLALDVQGHFIQCYAWMWCADGEDCEGHAGVLNRVNRCCRCLEDPIVQRVRKRVGACLPYSTKSVGEIVCAVAEEVLNQKVQPNRERLAELFIVH